MEWVLIVLAVAGVLGKCSSDPITYPPDDGGAGAAGTTTTSSGGDGGSEDGGGGAGGTGGTTGGAGGTTTTDTGGGGQGGTGGSGGVAGSGGTGGTTITGGPIGAPCAVPDDCESGNCNTMDPAGNVQGATGFCTLQPCNFDSQCGPGGVCKQLSPSVMLHQCVQACAETADCAAPFVCLPDLGACGVTK